MCQDVSGGKRPVLSHRRAATECDVERRRVRQCDAQRSIHQGFQNSWITAAFAWEILDGRNVVLAEGSKLPWPRMRTRARDTAEPLCVSSTRPLMRPVPVCCGGTRSRGCSG